MSKPRQFASRWFRVYDEAIDDPKLQMLSDKLHRFLFACWCLASKHDGYLPPVQEIAWRLRKTESAIAGMIAELHERGLLDDEADTFEPHNWSVRQYVSDFSTPRVKKFRERKKGSTETAPQRDETTAQAAPQAKADPGPATAEAETRRAAISEQEWPEVTAAIQDRFPSVDGMFVLRLVQDTIQAAISSNIDPALVTDRALAAAVQTSFRTDNVKRAGLLLRTVPTIIRTWGRR